MCIGLIGGMDRLGKHYLREADRFDIRLKVFSQWRKNLSKKLSSLDALVLFTDKVSHMAKKEAVEVARSRNIPLVMVHSSGLSTFRNCLESIKNHGKKGD